MHHVYRRALLDLCTERGALCKAPMILLEGGSPQMFRAWLSRHVSGQRLAKNWSLPLALEAARLPERMKEKALCATYHGRTYYVHTFLSSSESCPFEDGETRQVSILLTLSSNLFQCSLPTPFGETGHTSNISLVMDQGSRSQRPSGPRGV